MGGLATMLPIKGPFKSRPEQSDKPFRAQPMPPLLPAEHFASAGRGSSPDFQLSPAIAAAMNPNNPAFDPAVRDSWKAAMKYMKLADRGKGRGRGTRRGRPQRYSTLSRQEHAFYLEHAGILFDSS